MRGLRYEAEEAFSIIMDSLFRDFGEATSKRAGYQLASTFTPEAPSSDPDRLLKIWRSTNYHEARNLIKRNIQRATSSTGLSRSTVEGWVEVYYLFWKAIGEILTVTGQLGDNDTTSWTKVFETWRDLTTAITRGYTNHGFEAWSIPCVYVIGKYLRIFAIKADDERSKNANDQGASFQDDFDPETEKHQHLEDCARQLNRIFTLCLSDRTPDLAESRTWGIYGVINLLFKTYFRLNSASLSRNVLKALNAYQGDMPALDSFPLSQQVTFKYYQGVLFFLEENYTEVCSFDRRLVMTMLTTLRQRSI